MAVKLQLIKLLNEILWDMENQKIIVLICIDLSAAFDTADHHVLLQVMRQYFGIDGTVLKWLTSYLSDRRMKVSVGDCFSKEINLPYSVPQGSCCGAQIFNWYASTLQDHISETVDLNAYADDHTLKSSFDPNTPDSERDTYIARIN